MSTFVLYTKPVFTSGDTAVRAGGSLVEVDHTYSQDIMEKVDIGTTTLLTPCAGEDIPSFSNQINVLNGWEMTL